MHPDQTDTCMYMYIYMEMNGLFLNTASSVGNLILVLQLLYKV